MNEIIKNERIILELSLFINNMLYENNKITSNSYNYVKENIIKDLLDNNLGKII